MVCAVKHGIIHGGDAAAAILFPLFSFIKFTGWPVEPSAQSSCAMGKLNTNRHINTVYKVLRINMGFSKDLVVH